MSTNNTPAVDWRSEVEQAVLAMKGEGQKAYTFMKQEAPEVAREYVTWKRASTAIEGLLTIAVIAIGVWSALKLFLRKPKQVERYGEMVDEDMTGYWFSAAFISFFTIGAIGFLCSDSSRILKPWLAPRIVVLEGIKEVVR